MNPDLAKKIQCCNALKAELEIWNQTVNELRDSENVFGPNASESALRYVRRMNDLADYFINAAKDLLKETLVE